jgi:hypothetical protein
MSFQIKASSINNLTDARYFNALENTYIGFNFDVLHPQHLNLSQAEEIVSWLYNPPLIAEFGIHQTKEEIDYILDKIPFVGIEIPYENRNIYNDYNKIRFLKITAPFAAYETMGLDFLIIDLNNSQINISNQHLSIFVEIEDPKSQMIADFDFSKFKGVSLKGKKEERPGWSMVDEWADFIERKIDILEK